MKLSDVDLEGGDLPPDCRLHLVRKKTLGKVAVAATKFDFLCIRVDRAAGVSGAADDSPAVHLRVGRIGHNMNARIRKTLFGLRG